MTLSTKSRESLFFDLLISLTSKHLLWFALRHLFLLRWLLTAQYWPSTSSVASCSPLPTERLTTLKSSGTSCSFVVLWHEAFDSSETERFNCSGRLAACMNSVDTTTDDNLSASSSLPTQTHWSHSLCLMYTTGSYAIVLPCKNKTIQTSFVKYLLMKITDY